MRRRLSFLHPLTRDAAYAALLEPNRAALHRAAAEVLEQRHRPGTAEERDLLRALLDHLARSGQFEKAHRYACDLLYQLARASSLTLARVYELRAQELWSLACRIQPELPEHSCRLLWASAELRIAEGALPAAEASLELLIPAARARRDTEHLCRGLTTLGSLRIVTGELTEAEDLLCSAEALASMLDDLTLQRFVSSVLGTVKLRQGDQHAARELMQRALELAREQDNTARIAAELSNLASVETALGLLDAAEAHYRESLRLSEWLGNNYLVSLASGNLGDLLHERGKDEEARQLLLEALAIARLINSPMLLAYWQNSLGYLELDSADPIAARVQLEGARQSFAALGDRVQLSSTLAGLALCALATDWSTDGAGASALDEAERLAREAQELADACGIGPAAFTRKMLTRFYEQRRSRG